MLKKNIIILIGKKGSGKSHIGTIFDKKYGFKFIRVEDWAKEIKKDREVDDAEYISQVFKAIESGIRKSTITFDNIIFESTGLTDHFDEMLNNLKNDFNVRTINISCDPQLCLERVNSRDKQIHINISDEKIMMINKMVDDKNIMTDLEISNHGTEEDLYPQIEKIRRYIQN